MLVAVGAFVVIACALAGAEVAARVDHRSGFLAVDTYVPQGGTVTAADLTVVSLSAGGGLAAVPAGDAGAVVGRRASEPLEPGSLLTPADVTVAAPLPPGDALVGSSLSTAQAPGGLAAGTPVIVVLGGQGAAVSAGGGTGAAAAAAATGTPSRSTTSPAPGSFGSNVLAVGTVYAVAAPPESDATSGDEIVTLEVPKSEAAAVTAASAIGDVSLAEIGEPAS
jgi:hypothetical protein